VELARVVRLAGASRSALAGAPTQTLGDMAKREVVSSLLAGRYTECTMLTILTMGSGTGRPGKGVKEDGAITCPNFQ